MRKTDTKERALAEGQSLLQKHGYNGFSFQDIAAKLGIKKPSLYDHFASKDELIVAILLRYRKQFDLWTEGVSDLPPLEQIQKVFDVFHLFSSDKRKVCPVLSLAADFQSLSKEIQEGMLNFVENWLGWLESRIKEGQKLGDIRRDIKAKPLASLIYSQGMGSQFQARIKDDPNLTLSSGNFIISILKP